jgi:hypothetical protein
MANFSVDFKEARSPNGIGVTSLGATHHALYPVFDANRALPRQGDK